MGAQAQLCKDLCDGSESFKTLQMGEPRSASAERKLRWLRSQIIGADAEFDSPFGRRKLSYADHNASGRCLRFIESFVTNHVLPFYGNTHTSNSYVGHRTTKMAHEAAKYIKRCLGGDEGDAIIFCGSGSTAAIKRLQEVMGIAIPSILRDKVLSCLSVEERWLVFVGPYEHHSNLLSWRQSLAEVVEIGLDEDGLIDLEALRKHLEAYKHANRPILGSFSACSNVTGLYTDTRAIARLLHHYGGFACFDFAASGPYVEIDMRSREMDGYDAIFLSPHKFLGGPGSPGILLMSKALYKLGSSPPTTCGGGTVNYVNGFNEKDTLYFEAIEERENGGTPQIIQMIKAALAFWVKEYVGYEVIEKQESLYIQEALKRLLPNGKIKILGNTIANRQATLSFLTYSSSNEDGNVDQLGVNDRKGKPLNGSFVATLLNDLFGIQARGGCACSGPYGHVLLEIDDAHSLAIRAAIQKGFVGTKPGWTRISFPYYMPNNEFQFILAAVEFIASHGHRFLSLYHFDLQTGDWTFDKKKFKNLVGKGKNHNIHVLTLARAMQSIGLGHDRPSRSNDADNKDACAVCKYASYLESAKHIAKLLPEFPSPQRLVEDIAQDLLIFKV